MDRQRVKPRQPSGPPNVPPSTGVSRLIIKFRDDFPIPYEDKAERHLPEREAAQWNGIPGNAANHINRLFTAVKIERLQELVNRAKKLDPHYVPPKFAAFFAVETPKERVSVLRSVVADWAIVEQTYFDPPGFDPATVNPDDDDPVAGWVTMQGYLDPAPDGIDAECAWPRANGDGFQGGAGEGVHVIDLEQGWQLDHPDLVDHNIHKLHGEINPSSVYHGTGVLGILCARDNTIGCVGIAPWVAKVDVVSHHMSSRADALLAAINVLSAGDVLVVEVQINVTIGVTWFLMPVEAAETEFQLIRLATALGIVVVEAAGNGWESLDDFVDGAGHHVLNRADPSFRDSGAILVSAATSTVPHSPIFMFGDRIHHYGSRVDCYAWGDNVTTLDKDSGYTTGFANTSAATPIIAGAAAVVQGIARARGITLSPWQIRGILSDPNNGTLSANGALDGLGVMPDLKKILVTNDVLNLRPDLYLRDFVGDTGDPHLGAASASPDVIVVPGVSADPSADFGDPDLVIDARVEAGQSNFVYLRAWNRGSSDAVDVNGTVYWAEPSTLVTPDQWHLLGTTVWPLVAAGNVPTLSEPIEWLSSNIPAAGHYCFIAILDHPQDPNPGAAGLGSLDWEQYLRFIRDNNNITWRNFNIVDDVLDSGMSSGAGKYLVLPFIAAGAPDRAREMQLIISASVPDQSILLIDLPLSLLEWASRARLEVQWKGKTRFRIHLAPPVVQLQGLRIPARARLPMTLLLTVPPELLRGDGQDAHEVYVSQWCEGRELGRVTWSLVDQPVTVKRRHSAQRARAIET